MSEVEALVLRVEHATARTHGLAFARKETDRANAFVALAIDAARVAETLGAENISAL